MGAYNQFCPVARACTALTDRWTPLVLRELLMGSYRFNDLRKGVPLMSRSLLATRLRQLEEAGVVARIPKPDGKGQEYRLTAAGEQARPIIEQLAVWGDRWLRAPLREEELDPGLLMWDLRRGLDLTATGTRRVVVKFALDGLPRSRHAVSTWWLLVEAGSADLCVTDPGHRVDLTVRADLEAFTAFWIGRAGWTLARAEGRIRVEGPGKEAEALARWLGAAPPDGFRTPWYQRLPPVR